MEFRQRAMPPAVAAADVAEWRRCFGDARQVGYVTTDLMKTIRFFIDNARIGPWFVAADRYLRQANYRGAVMDVNLSTAHANSGGMQIEIIEPDPAQQTIYSEWLAQGERTLVQHIAFWVPDFQAALRLANARGYEVIMRGTSAQGGFAYLQHRDMREFTFEVTELTPDRLAKYDRIAKAAAQWDGSSPVRSP